MTTSEISDNTVTSSDLIDNENFAKKEWGNSSNVNMARGVIWKPLGIGCEFKDCKFEAYAHCDSDICCIWSGCGKAVCLHHVTFIEQPCCTFADNNV